jgi:hypothetical protein
VGVRALRHYAKKHNLKVEYSSNTLIRDELGISLFTGTNDHKEKKPLNAANYFEIYNVDLLLHLS